MSGIVAAHARLPNLTIAASPPRTGSTQIGPKTWIRGRGPDRTLPGLARHSFCERVTTRAVRRHCGYHVSHGGGVERVARRPAKNSSARAKARRTQSSASGTPGHASSTRTRASIDCWGDPVVLATFPHLIIVLSPGSGLVLYVNRAEAGQNAADFIGAGVFCLRYIPTIENAIEARSKSLFALANQLASSCDPSTTFGGTHGS